MSYRGIQVRAYDTAVEADLRNFSQKMALYTAENGPALRGNAGVAVFKMLETFEWKASKDAYADTSSNLTFCHNYSPASVNSGLKTAEDP